MLIEGPLWFLYSVAILFSVFLTFFSHSILQTMHHRRSSRVGKGVGHLDHWSCGVRKVVSSIPDRGNIVGLVFHPTRWLVRFSLIWICLSFQILNLFRTLSSWGSGNYRPSAPLLYEVASHVKKLPFRPILLLLLLLFSIPRSCLNTRPKYLCTACVISDSSVHSCLMFPSTRTLFSLPIQDTLITRIQHHISNV